MKASLLSVLAAGALVIGATAWATYPRRTQQPAAGGTNYKYMHCPECDRESAYSAAALELGCLRCGKPLVPTAESVGTGPKRSPYTRMFLAVYTEVLALMAAVWFVTRPRPEGEITCTSAARSAGGSCGTARRRSAGRGRARGANTRSCSPRTPARCSTRTTDRPGLTAHEARP